MSLEARTKRVLDVLLIAGLVLNASTLLTGRRVGQSTPDRLARRVAALCGAPLHIAALWFVWTR
jgi:hypothetical protein